MRAKRMLVAGASRGIGLEVARHRAALGDAVISVSRTPSVVGEWVEADLATAEGCAAVAEAVGDRAMDALLFLGGTWETDAFTRRFDFATCSDADLKRVIEVNLLAPIRLVQKLLPALERAEAAQVVLMGSLSGLPHRTTPEVANTASKFGLQGVAQALGKMGRVRTTVINPGNVATPEVLADLAAGETGNGVAIPMADLLASVDLVLGLSATTVVERLDLASFAGRGRG